MWTSALLVEESISRGTAWASGGLRSAFTTTDAPPSASASAIARPILRPAPVTMATLPMSSLVLAMRALPVMAGLVPAIHVLSIKKKDVDARHKAGDDDN